MAGAVIRVRESISTENCEKFDVCDGFVTVRRVPLSARKIYFDKLFFIF